MFVSSGMVAGLPWGGVFVDSLSNSPVRLMGFWGGIAFVEGGLLY